MKTTLSDVPSEAIEQALADLELAERDPRYIVQMAHWHQPSFTRRRKSDVTCMVCLAGAVMAQAINDPGYDATVSDFEDENKLLGLDSFRLGFVHSGLVRFRRERLSTLPVSVGIADYSSDPEKFKRDMHQLAATLKEHGL